MLEVKIRMEERLMVATFPDEYPRYRRRVPQLVPGLNVLFQPHSAAPSLARPALESYTIGS